MQKILLPFAFILLPLMAFAVTPRVAANYNSLPAKKATIYPSAVSGITTDKSSTQPIVVEPLVPKPSPSKPNRDKEKQACIQNNIGVGNTFVWASKYSNANNYATMVEDVENPDNNVCFVKIEIKSADSKISVADIKPVYRIMGDNITCGSWADADMLRQRILDARRSGRTWGTIAGVVGGAGVGVGAMELFGNRAIGGSVMGQKQNGLSETEKIKAQLATLKEKDAVRYNNFMAQIKELQDICSGTDWGNETPPPECEDYEYLF